MIGRSASTTEKLSIEKSQAQNSCLDRPRRIEKERERSDWSKFLKDNPATPHKFMIKK
jgi:hypothetical protein